MEQLRGGGIERYEIHGNKYLLLSVVDLEAVPKARIIECDTKVEFNTWQNGQLISTII